MLNNDAPAPLRVSYAPKQCVAACHQGADATSRTTTTKPLVAGLRCVDDSIRQLTPELYSAVVGGVVLARAIWRLPRSRPLGAFVPLPSLPSLPSLPNLAADPTVLAAERQARWTKRLEAADTTCVQNMRAVDAELKKVQACLAQRRPASGILRILQDPILAPVAIGLLVVVVVASLPLLALTLGGLAGFASWYALRDDDPTPPESDLIFAGTSPKFKAPKLLERKLQRKWVIFVELDTQLARARAVTVGGKKSSSADGDRSSLHQAAQTAVERLYAKRQDIRLLEGRMGAIDHEKSTKQWFVTAAGLSMLPGATDLDFSLKTLVLTVFGLGSRAYFFSAFSQAIRQGCSGFLGSLTHDYQQMTMQMELLRGEEEALVTVGKIYGQLLEDGRISNLFTGAKTLCGG